MKFIVFDIDNNTMFKYLKSANIYIVCVENITKPLFTESFKDLMAVTTSSSAVKYVSFIKSDYTNTYP